MKYIMSELYLVRHGLINYKTFLLDEDGKKLSEDLVSILKDRKIDFIASSNESRCIETLLPISNERQLEIQRYTKEDFINLVPLKEMLINSDSTILICYRLEEINCILNALNQKLFTEGNKDSSYEKIIHLTLNDRQVVDYEEILINFKKKNPSY